MVRGKTERRVHLDLIQNGEILEEVDSFKVFRINCEQEWGVVEDVISRVNEGD